MEKEKITNEELKRVLSAYNKDKPISQKRISVSVRTAKYVTAGLFLAGAFAARQFLSIGRA